MNLETKITIYKFTPQLFTLTPIWCNKKLLIRWLFFESHEKTTDMYHTSLILNDLRESFSGMKFYICIPY